MTSPAGDRRDPVRARRARARRWADAGQRAGYGCLLVAVVAFAVGALTEFSAAVVTIVVVALATGSAVLAPAIIVGYGVRAAEREDPGPGRSRAPSG